MRACVRACLRACVRAYVCVRVCLCVCEHAHEHTHPHTTATIKERFLCDMFMTSVTDLSRVVRAVGPREDGGSSSSSLHGPGQGHQVNGTDRLHQVRPHPHV